MKLYSNKSKISDSSTCLSICVVRLSALGDVIMVLPLIETLKKSFPQSEITFVTCRQFEPIVKGIKNVNIIYVDKIKSVNAFISTFRLFRKCKFDILLATQASFSAHLFYLCIRAKRKIGYDSIRSKDLHGLFINERISFKREHTVDGFLSFAEFVGAQAIVRDINILGDKEPDIDWVRNMIGSSNYFVVNPISAKSCKNWPLDRLSEVISFTLEHTDLNVVIIGTADAIHASSQLEQMIAKKERVFNLAGKTNIEKLISLIQFSNFLLSSDSGPIHLAGILNVPVVALYSTTSPEITGPWFPNSYVVNRHQEALTRSQSKRKVRSDWNVRLYNENAMELITVEDVIKPVSSVVGLA